MTRKNVAVKRMPNISFYVWFVFLISREECHMMVRGI